jgi:hypothetical protein
MRPRNPYAPNADFVDLLREVLRLRPLPVEPAHSSRKVCACGRKHRFAASDQCAKCRGWKGYGEARKARVQG